VIVEHLHFQIDDGVVVHLGFDVEYHFLLGGIIR
jgi:hypothetical protein